MRSWGWESDSTGLVSLVEKEGTPGVHVLKEKATWGCKGKTGVYKPRREAAGETKLAHCQKYTEPQAGLPQASLANICWIFEKAREFQKNIYFCFIDYAKAFDCVNHNQLWKILKEMGIPDHLTCLLRNLYASQEATVRTGHRTTDWFQTGKGVCKSYILSLCLFNLYAEYIMRNAGLEET